jgi:hypothetical protein
VANQQASQMQRTFDSAYKAWGECQIQRSVPCVAVPAPLFLLSWCMHA